MPNLNHRATSRLYLFFCCNPQTAAARSEEIALIELSFRENCGKWTPAAPPARTGPGPPAGMTPFDAGPNVITEVIKSLDSSRCAQLFGELIESRADFGATIKEQADGTVLLTLPFDNMEAVTRPGVQLPPGSDLALRSGSAGVPRRAATNTAAALLHKSPKDRG